MVYIYITENPIKMDDLGYPHFPKPEHIYLCMYIYISLSIGDERTRLAERVGMCCTSMGIRSQKIRPNPNEQTSSLGHESYVMLYHNIESHCIILQCLVSCYIIYYHIMFHHRSCCFSQRYPLVIFPLLLNMDHS